MRTDVLTSLGTGVETTRCGAPGGAAADSRRMRQIRVARDTHARRPGPEHGGQCSIGRVLARRGRVPGVCQSHARSGREKNNESAPCHSALEPYPARPCGPLALVFRAVARAWPAKVERSLGCQMPAGSGGRASKGEGVAPRRARGGLGAGFCVAAERNGRTIVVAQEAHGRLSCLISEDALPMS